MAEMVNTGNILADILADGRFLADGFLADGRNNDFISQHHNIVHSSFKIYQFEKIIKEPLRMIKYMNKRFAIENYGRDSVFINQHLNNVHNLSKNLSI